MHGLLSVSVRPIHIQRIAIQKIIRCFSGTTAPLQSKAGIGKGSGDLVVKKSRKMDPFSAEHNDPTTNFKHHMGFHGFELYPIQVQVFAWATILALIAYYACAKIEVVMDRSYHNTPFIWAALKNRSKDYVAFCFEPEPRIPRLALLETLQEEMIEEAKKRGTRK